MTHTSRAPAGARRRNTTRVPLTVNVPPLAEIPPVAVKGPETRPKPLIRPGAMKVPPPVLVSEPPFMINCASEVRLLLPTVLSSVPPALMTQDGGALVAQLFVIVTPFRWTVVPLTVSSS